MIVTVVLNGSSVQDVAPVTSGTKTDGFGSAPVDPNAAWLGATLKRMSATYVSS